jgi:prephenate dehydratase
MKNDSVKSHKIAIQGGYGAFHEIAAYHFFESENIEIVPRETFKDLFDTLQESKVDYGITAIENSLAGSILPNYGLILQSNMQIVGEIFLRIKQNLIALPGQTMDDIEEVYSHPMAILQCQKFFEQYPNIRLIDYGDTATSARVIKEKGLKHVAAIASNEAAKKYNMETLFSSIETNKNNYTRFLILRDRNGTFGHKEADKASLHFSLSHQIGSLAKILMTLSFYNINLTKIQSTPIIGRDWEYQFYVDVMFDDYYLYQKALDAIRPFTKDLHVLGEYKKGKTITE